MREFKVQVSFDDDDKVIIMEPVKASKGRISEVKVMVVRLYHPEEIDQEASECMQQDVHTYGRVHNRVRQRK